MFKSDGTIDKIFTGGAGKNGATVAVSDPSFSLYFARFLSMLHALPVFLAVRFCAWRLI